MRTTFADLPPKGSVIYVRGVTPELARVDVTGTFLGWEMRSRQIDVLVDGKLRSFHAELVEVSSHAGSEAAEARAQDHWNYPHDEPCPKCGRRQWTDETAQETCQACGYVYA